ncbi:MAG: hypothetical protein ACHREM_12435 [Polyangiales bacterium]
MNRVWIALAFAVVGSSAAGCSPSAVGDPCTPEGEFVVTSTGADPTVFRVDLNSVQCETRVCMSHYFRGRVSCPYGNDQPGVTDATSTTIGACLEVPNYRGFFTKDGTTAGKLCCPVLGVDPNFPGDSTQSPAEPAGNTILRAVPAQCADRQASDAVYCTCRCDVPSVDPTDPSNPNKAVDKSQLSLCACPNGFQCVNLCDNTHGNCSTLPFGKWGSYCVKAASASYDDSSKVTSVCSDVSPPLAPPTN